MWKKVKRFFNTLGPGFVTGAADDDPSGVATFSIAGAQYGYQLNWLSLFLIPMMISIQEMCGRIGMTAGMGLAGVIKKFHSKLLLDFTLSLLLIANIINIAADLGIMAASVQMIFGLPFLYWLAVITIVCIGLEILVPYKTYSKILTALGLTLLVYVITALIVRQDWKSVALYTLLPHIDLTLPYFITMVGLIGTSISPYLFFWQPSEEIEEEILKGEIRDFRAKPHIRTLDIIRMRRDTNVGMIFSNIISMCIILTAAATLHTVGITDIETPQQAALALKPIAGNFAFILFTIGVIGIGLQSIPVLAGGIGYALAETLNFKEGLGKTFRQAKGFYIIIGLATAIGALINIIGINPIKALYYSAIINGIISVPLIFIIIRLADDPRVVGTYKTPVVHRVVAWITFAFISLASIFMLVNIFKLN